MKKLIIAVAIVCAAVVAQAATVDWQASAAVAYNGKTMYLLTSLADSYKDADAVKNASVSYGTVAKSGPSSYKIAKKSPSDKSITKSANFYLAVISDDGKTLHYVDVTGTTQNPGMQALVYDPPDASPGAYAASFATVATSSLTKGIGSTPEPTPEPTSAMLLLLGVAGLALKRKRA